MENVECNIQPVTILSRFIFKQTKADFRVDHVSLKLILLLFVETNFSDERISKQTPRM